MSRRWPSCSQRGDGYLFEIADHLVSSEAAMGPFSGLREGQSSFRAIIKPACLFCHSNQFDHVEGTENRYREPIFRGHAVGCERCHGPGELHVREPEPIGGEPSTIVNPARLPPALREAVCQQCHLQGDIRIVRAGRSLTDYPAGAAPVVHRIGVREGGETRSGPVLRAGRADVREPLLPRELRQDGLHLLPRSPRAFPAREGDVLPRTLPELPRREELQSAEERASVAGSGRRCIDCHMPRSPNEQVPHTATTLHLIPRFKERGNRRRIPARRRTGRDGPLAHFHRDQLERGEASRAARDLGIALATNPRAIPGLTASAASRMALPLLDRALEADPTTAPPG